MTSRVLAGPATQIDSLPLPKDQLVAGAPNAGMLDFGTAGFACGLWEHSEGVSTDVEADEVFVVLSGRARIEIVGQQDLEIEPGNVVLLEAGAETTWHVTEPLRKFWVTATG
ncbi:MAG: cupin domain-containing protein [Actinomycetia bacterium]|nr:cupin domain-containing protein [Actinomycetes bacterium]MCH9799993.1 cupin domain-containing protein [Actinomycetes bacterium]